MKKRKRINQCPNCQTMLSAKDNFCPSCGQENHYTDLSMKELFYDFFGSLFNFDGKIWNTLKTIVLQPGQITKQYVEGKRIRFVPPFKLYLFFSFIIFILLSLSLKKASHSEFVQQIYFNIHQVSRGDMLEIDKTQYLRLKDADYQQINAFVDSVFQHKTKWNKLTKEQYYATFNKQMLDEPKVKKITTDIEIGAKKEQYGYAIQVKRKTESDTLPITDTKKEQYGYAIQVQRKMEYDTISMNELKITMRDLKKMCDYPQLTDSLIATHWKNADFLEKAKIKNELQTLGVFSFGTVHQMTEYIDNTIDRILSLSSYTMLLMMPCAALFLLAFYRKKYSFFYPHLIHSIHLHTVGYLFLIPIMGVFVWLNMNTLFLILFLVFLVWLFVYFLISNKVVYEERKRSTILKSIVLAFVYVLFSSVAILYISAVLVMYT